MTRPVRSQRRWPNSTVTRFPSRPAHWGNVLCLPILLLSGFQIFNAHPALYWGERSDRDRPILSMGAMITPSGELQGITNVLGYRFDTTGVLGSSGDESRGFPSWATLPGSRWLAMGRRWHCFFAWLFEVNGVLFALYALVSRHLTRDLFPRGKDLRGIPRAIWDHLLFRHPRGEEAARYMRLEVVERVGTIAGGHGGYWEDQGYEWYAGI